MAPLSVMIHTLVDGSTVDVLRVVDGLVFYILGQPVVDTQQSPGLNSEMGCITRAEERGVEEEEYKVTTGTTAVTVRTTVSGSGAKVSLI